MAVPLSPRSARASNTRRTTAKQRRQSHVLDVTVRASHAARQRNQRLFRFVGRLVTVGAIGIAIYFGARKGIAWLLLKNPDYNVAEMNVETDGVLTPEVVLQSADLHKGSNIFLVNLDRARARIEGIPQVEKAQVSRQLPNRIAIQINERKPIAWVAANRTSSGRDEIVNSPASHLVDAHGILLPSAHAAPQDRYLPIIRNYSNSNRTDGQEVEGEEIKAALDLLHAHQDSTVAARFQIQEIDLAKQFGIVATDRNGFQVLFGLDDMDRQLKRLDVNLQALDQSGQKPQSINLMVQKNVPVTFVTEPVVAPEAAPSPTPPGTVVSNAKAATSLKAKTSTTKGVDKEHLKTKSAADKPHKHNSKPGLQPFKAN